MRIKPDENVEKKYKTRKSTFSTQSSVVDRYAMVAKLADVSYSKLVTLFLRQGLLPETLSESQKSLIEICQKTYNSVASDAEENIYAEK